MYKKTAIIMLSVTCLALGANLVRVKIKHQKDIDELQKNPHTEKLEQLEAEKQAWNARENDLLRQNGELVVQVNELKMQIEKKPQTIYITKNEKNNTIDRNASDEFTRILTGRYGTVTGE